MDDYRDVDALYVKALEKLLKEAGIELPNCWGHIHDWCYTMDHVYYCSGCKSYKGRDWGVVK